MRPNRILTPTHYGSHSNLTPFRDSNTQHHQQQQQPPPKKYYTRDEVSQILRQTLESKLSKIYRELDEKQKLIKSLNEQLSQNDHKMSLLENKMRSMHVQEHNYEIIIETTNKLLNDKLQGYYVDVRNQLQGIREQNQGRARKMFGELERELREGLKAVTNTCAAHIDSYKKKNNAYWQKIKETLGKMNGRIKGIQDTSMNIGKQINKFQSEMRERGEQRKELEKGRKSVEMFLELRKSVNNLYSSYEEVLKLQELVRDRANDEIFGECAGCRSAMHRNSGSKNSSVNSMKNRDSLVMLEYSLEDQTVSMMSNKKGNQSSTNNNSNNNHNNKQANYYNNYSTAQKANQPSKPLITSNTHKIPMNNYQPSSNMHENLSPPVSPIQNRLQDHINEHEREEEDENNEGGEFSETFNLTVEQQYLDSNKDSRMSLGKRSLSKNNQSNFHNISTTTTPNINPFYQNTNNSSSFLNFSLEARREMLESIKPRLMETVNAKGLGIPLKLSLDKFDYLKDEEGNFLFDLKGNMFKCTAQDYATLKKQGIIAETETGMGMGMEMGKTQILQETNRSRSRSQSRHGLKKSNI